MKTRYVGPPKTILVLAMGILMCSAVAGNSSEPWDAKTSARVNLRRNPSSDGAILSIVPKGHKVRILEKKGLWSKVDVEGDIHGKGWIYAQYLAEILPKVPATEPASQTERVEIASGEPRQGIHPAELPPKVRTESEAAKPLRSRLPGKTSVASHNEQSSARDEQPETKLDIDVQSKAEIFELGESAHIGAIQPLPEVQTEVEETNPQNNLLFCNVSKTGAQQQFLVRNELRDAKNESIALSQVDLPIAREPAHISPAQTASADLKQDALGFSEKSSKTKGLINHPESIGLVELTLKILAIALSGLVILLLYKANKIASNHYDALMQFQHSLDSRQRR